MKKYKELIVRVLYNLEKKYPNGCSHRLIADKIIEAMEKMKNE